MDTSEYSNLGTCGSFDSATNTGFKPPSAVFSPDMVVSTWARDLTKGCRTADTVGSTTYNDAFDQLRKNQLVRWSPRVQILKGDIV